MDDYNTGCSVRGDVLVAKQLKRSDPVSLDVFLESGGRGDA